MSTFEAFSHEVILVIFFYDHILTFHGEYVTMWKAPRSIASWLFFLNRYITLIMVLMPVVPITSQVMFQSHTYSM